MLQSRNERQQNSNYGFSLTEILIVVSILGIIAVVVVPSLYSTNTKKLDVAVNEVAQLIRFAGSEAKRLQKPVGFKLQSSLKQFRVFSVDTTTTPWSAVYDIYHPLSKNLYDISLTTFPNAGVDKVILDASYKSSCNTTADIYFDVYGSAWCLDPNNIAVTKFNVELYLGEFKSIVGLDPISGRVFIK